MLAGVTIEGVPLPSPVLISKTAADDGILIPGYLEIRIGSLDEAPTGLGHPLVEGRTERREEWLAPVAGAEQSPKDPSL